ncbi:MAG: phosphoribosyltransferase, partial [Candidatus Latescibacterota bacterium]
LHHVLALFKDRNPKSLKVCSLLKKRVERLHEVPVDYCGFEIDDLFVVGFGLDFDGIYRSLNYIAVLELPDGKEPE